MAAARLINRRALVAGLAAISSFAAMLWLASGSRADIHAAQVLAGPTNDLVEVAGAAMAPDGDGGVLYRARVEGVMHLYVIPFDEGRWGSPLEVDGEDPYGASEPAIAAGEGGRLLVVWVQPRNTSQRGSTLYELQSASLAPGASGFSEAITVDANVGEPYTGNAAHVEPRLAMAPDGSAYVVYRVVTDECRIGGPDADNPRNPECPPSQGRELVDVRAARFDYLLWSSLGNINRDRQIATPDPTAANAPTIGVSVEGNGVVAWQEPENAGDPARIWTRRLFGAVKGTVLAASPESIDGRPITSEAEAPEIAVSRFGEARLTYRIVGGRGSAVGTTQLFLNSLPSSFDPSGGKFEGSVALPGATADGLGPSSAAVDPSGNFRLAWTQEENVRLVSGGLQGLGTPTTIGTSDGPALTTISASGGGTTTWTASEAGRPVVEVREDFTNGAYQAATLAGDVPGAVSGLSLGGSGQGDALTAWMQGPPGRSEVVGDFVQAPPSTLIVSTPSGWVRKREATVTWEPVSDAAPGVSYSIYVDGRELMSGLRQTSVNLRSALLGNGLHQVQVLATDSANQRTMSVKAPLKIDVDPPIVRVELIDHRRGVQVRVSDDASGVDAQATRISFGDGAHSSEHARARHLYRHAGLYTITAKVRDNVGIGATVHIRVKVR
jgi:PKD domain